MSSIERRIIEECEECNESTLDEKGAHGLSKEARAEAGKSYSKEKEPEKYFGTAHKIQKAMDKSKKGSMAYDEGMTETVIIDAVKTWAAHPLAEGIRMTNNTVMIGNTRVAERNFEAKHARMLKPGALTEDADRRTRDLIERGLRDAGYKVELVDAFTG